MTEPKLSQCADWSCIFNPLQCLPALRLDREEKHAERCSQDETSRRVDGSLGISVGSIDSDNWGTKTRNAIHEASDTGTSATVGGREDLWRVCVQHTVHDVLEECFETAEGELELRVAGDGEQEDEYARDNTGDCHRPATTEPRNLNQVVGEEGSRYTHDGGDGVVSVDDAWIGWHVASGVGEILREECIEKWVTHTDGCPLEP